MSAAASNVMHGACVQGVLHSSYPRYEGSALIDSSLFWSIIGMDFFTD